MYKKCRYSNCQKQLYISDKTVKGCCSAAHAKWAKKEYNYNYYQNRRVIILTDKYSSMLRTFVKQFGEAVPIEAEFLEHIDFDWDFSTGKIAIDNLEYTTVGDYAYTIFKNKKVKIIRL